MTFIILIWFILCVAAAMFASRYHRFALGWFICAFIFSPLVAFIFLLALGKRGGNRQLIINTEAGQAFIEAPPPPLPFGHRLDRIALTVGILILIILAIANGAHAASLL
jgi:hypothetical protein